MVWKRNNNIFFYLFFVFWGCTPAHTSDAPQTTLKIAFDYPKKIVSEEDNLPISQEAIAWIETLSKSHNISIQYIDIPYVYLLSALLAEEVDIIIIYFSKPIILEQSIQKKIWMSPALNQKKLAILYSFEQINQYLQRPDESQWIGVRAGQAITFPFEQYFPAAKKQYMASYWDGLRALREGNIIFFIDEVSIIEELAQKFPYDLAINYSLLDNEIIKEEYIVSLLKNKMIYAQLSALMPELP